MPLLQAISNRRAVRKFETAPVSEEDITALTAAFQASPCAMHQADVMQGIIVTHQDLLAKVESATDNSCYGAPLLFILTTKQGSKFGERDSSVAAENIMIQASDLGLGTVYIMGGALALNKQTELLKELGVANGYEVSTIVPVGRPAETPAAEDRSHRYRLLRK